VSDIISQFDLLCDVAVAAFGEELEISYEMSLLHILDFVKQHPDHKQEFINRFKQILISQNSPFEAVAFCMRDLQWPEIREFMILKMNPLEDPRTEALRSTLTAYEEFWPDADLYTYYNIK